MIVFEASGGNPCVNGLAEVAVVPVGNVGCDQFAVALSKGVGPMQSRPKIPLSMPTVDLLPTSVKDQRRVGIVR